MHRGTLTSINLGLQWVRYLNRCCSSCADADSFLFAGPPLHDALCVLHVAQPELLPGRWAHLSVDTSDTERNGETKATFFSPEGAVDRWEDREKFLAAAQEEDAFSNCYVMETLDREAFMRVLLECVDRAEEVIAGDRL